MRDAEAQHLASLAAEAWGGAEKPPRLVAKRENTVFEVLLRDGRHVALRLHRPGYQGEGAINSELAFTHLLAASGFRCPPPVATTEGRLVVRIEGRLASAVRWFYGTPVGRAGTALEGNETQQAGLFRALGVLLAQLHDAADRLDLPSQYQRPYWDEDGLLGDAPLWGRFWTNPALGLRQRDLLLEAREAALGALARYRREGADFGMIHADPLRENLLLDEAGLALIDFDDCGFGFRFYDLGVALSQNVGAPNAAQLAQSLIEGYRSRRPMPENAVALVEMFTLIRALASCGWIVSRARPGDPRQAFYAGRAVRLAREFLDGGAPGP